MDVEPDEFARFRALEFLIRHLIHGQATTVTLDFAGIANVSDSFTDELFFFVRTRYPLLTINVVNANALITSKINRSLTTLV